MKAVLALALSIIILAAPAMAQQGAVDPNGWVKEIQTADKLLAAGYVDHALADYEAVIRKYPTTVAGIDKAWLGLARIHMQRYAYDQAKTSLEEILKRNSDPSSVQAAKGTYRQLRQEAEGQVQQAQKQLQMMEYQYAMTPWLNPFAKLFTYLDLRKVRAAAAAAKAQADGFDPHYFIDDVAASAIRSDYQLSGSEFRPAGFEAAASTPAPAASAAAGAAGAAGVSVHVGPPGAGGAASTTPVAAASAAPSSTASVAPVARASAAAPIALASAAAPSPAASAAASMTAGPSAAPSAAPIAVASAAPSPAASAAASATAASATAASQDLVSLQRAYQDAYRELQKAISMGNQRMVVEANKKYQAALATWKTAAEKTGRAP